MVVATATMLLAVTRIISSKGGAYEMGTRGAAQRRTGCFKALNICSETVAAISAPKPPTETLS